MTKKSFFEGIDPPIYQGDARVIPAGAEIITSVDYGSPDGDTCVVVRGFRKDGVFVIQSVIEEKFDVRN